MLGQAVGLGLIIAAALAARPAATGDRTATGDGTADGTGGQSAGAWVAVVAIAVLVVGGTWVVSSMRDQNAPPPEREEDVAAERCVTDNPPSPHLKQKPAQAMLLRQNEGWLRVYVSDADNWIIVCQGGPQALMAAFATVMPDQTDDEVLFFGGYDAVMKGHLLLGRPPEGTALIEARLADGRTLQGDHNGDIFVVWAPGVPVEGARVTFMRKDRAVITTASAPAG